MREDLEKLLRHRTEVWEEQRSLFLMGRELRRDLDALFEDPKRGALGRQIIEHRLHQFRTSVFS